MAIPIGKKLSRAQIKQRIMNDAAKLWKDRGFQVAQYDQLVEMLIGVCATEVKKIHDEIESSQTRVLERLAQLLTPDSYKGPIPAHAVISAQPLEATDELGREMQFYYHNKKLENDVFFSPIKSLPIWDAEITHLVWSNKLYEKQGLEKEELLSCARKLPKSDLYLGIDVNTDIQSLDGLRFFFDWDRISEKEKQFYFSLLPSTKWSLGDESCTHLIGLQTSESEKEETAFSLEKEFDISYKTEQKIEAWYKHQFVCVERIPLQDLSKGALPTYPKAFKQTFSEEELGELPPNLYWIKISFPEVFPASVLDKIFVGLNCFPAINRKLHRVPYRLHQNINIVDLKTENGYFFDTHSVNSDDVSYTHSPSVQIREGQKHTYTLRRGGTARYDQRDASAMLDYLFDLLRDESTAFLAMGKDVLASEVRALNQTISRLERTIATRNINREAATYLILRASKNRDNITAKYWSTHGANANNLPAATPLAVYSGVNFKRGKVMLVSKSQGGRNPLSPKESIHEYKQALMTRERIVTVADIKAVCHARLGDRLRSAIVSKGVKIGDQINQGLSRTIKVELVPHPESVLTEMDCKELSTILQSRSSGILPYEVGIHHPQN